MCSARLHRKKINKCGIAWLKKLDFGYGNTGCGVFKGGIQNYKGFGLKINCSQIKLLNFDNGDSQELILDH